jgi:hypothetical protein
VSYQYKGTAHYYYADGACTCRAGKAVRSLGLDLASREPRRMVEASVTRSIASRNAVSLALDGLVKPLTLRTNCSAASRISASDAGGSRLKSGLILLHIGDPFSKTYPDMDRPDLVFGSCFFVASFTRGLRLVPELAAPQAL